MQNHPPFLPMDHSIPVPCNPLVPIPKPLIMFLTFLEIIDYGLSAVLFRLGLDASFATQPSPWDHHSYGFIPSATVEFASSPRVVVPPSVIKRRLRAVAYSRFRDNKRSTCSVCLSGLEVRDVVRELGNCRHAFHRQCIDAWVDTGKVTCPLCRSQLLQAEERKEGIQYMVDLMRKKLW